MEQTTSSSPLGPPKLRRPRRGSWAQAVAAVTTLLSGVVIGACGLVVLGRGPLLHLLVGSSETVPTEAVERISRDLELTPSEVSTVRAIVYEHMERVDEIRLEAREEVIAELDALRDEVANSLTGEKSRRWRKRFDEARNEGFSPPAPRGGRRQGPQGPGTGGAQPSPGPDADPRPPSASGREPSQPPPRPDP